jgi:high-affinity K+ transport system ATPase subunit B
MAVSNVLELTDKLVAALSAFMFELILVIVKAPLTLNFPEAAISVPINFYFLDF